MILATDTLTLLPGSIVTPIDNGTIMGTDTDTADVSSTNVSKEKEIHQAPVGGSESKQRLHDKLQQPPGSWLARTTKSFWYLTYGLGIIFLKLKFFREFLCRNRSYDPGNEPSTFLVR